MCAVSVPSQAQTWTATSAPSNSWGAVTCSADGSHVAAAAGRGIASTGRIYISSDGGTNWSATSAPTLTWYAIASSADGSNLIAAAYLNGIYTSADGGATWRSNAINTVPSPTTWRAVAASADGTVLFAMPSGNDLMYRSTNAGASWLSSTSHLADTASIAVSADGAFVLGGDNSGHVANSTNSGATWGTNTSIGGYCGGVTVSPQGRRLLAATSTGGIFLSSNRGASWSNTGLPANAVWVGVASSADATRLAAVASHGQISTSSDSGSTWTSNNVPALSWQGVASSADGSVLFAAPSNGRIWVRRSTPAPVMSVAIPMPSAAANISWVVPSANFVLQQSTDPALSIWTDLTNTPTLDLFSLRYQVTIPMNSDNVFYRLKSL
jgi:hypothetical protein